MSDQPQQQQGVLSPTGLGYVYRWGDAYEPDLITIEVTRLRTKQGSLYALLQTSTRLQGARKLPGTDRVLAAEVSLLGERSRAGYAKALDQLIPAPESAAAINFGTLLEEVAQGVIEQENRPAEVKPLPTPDYNWRQTYLIDGLLPAYKPTILYGAGGVGKSIFAAAVAVAVQTGIQFLNRRTQQTEVLYLDWETDENDLATRVQAAARGLGLTAMPGVRYAALVRPIEDQVAALARSVDEEKVGLVIVDSVGMAMASARDGSDASEGAIRFFRALRGLKTAVLALDHVSGEDMRRGKAGAQKPYGSVYKWNSARNAYELRERTGADSQGVHLLLHHRKSNIGPLQNEVPLLLRWTEGKAIFTADAYTVPIRQPLPTQITALLETGPATSRQIADLLSDEKLGVVYEIDVRREAKRLINEGKIHAGADGQLRLARQESAAVQSTTLLQDDDA